MDEFTKVLAELQQAYVSQMMSPVHKPGNHSYCLILGYFWCLLKFKVHVNSFILSKTIILAVLQQINENYCHTGFYLPRCCFPTNDL